MTRNRWAWGHGVYVTLMSLIAAVWTENPNWPWNIPLGMAAGYVLGLMTWPAFQRLRGL